MSIMIVVEPLSLSLLTQPFAQPFAQHREKVLRTRQLLLEKVHLQIVGCLHRRVIFVKMLVVPNPENIRLLMIRIKRVSNDLAA